MIEAFATNAAEKLFTDGVRSWSLIRGSEECDGGCGCHMSKARPELAIVIAYQILGSLSIRGRFPKLLPYPGVSRRSCHAYVDHFPGLQEGEEERKKRSKEEIGHLQEVG